MKTETLKLYLPIKDLPVSGSFQSRLEHNRELYNGAENCVYRNFILEVLKANGYTLRAEKSFHLTESVNKYYWFTSLSIRWKDFADDEANAFQYIDFEEFFKENLEFYGYHTSKH